MNHRFLEDVEKVSDTSDEASTEKTEKKIIDLPEEIVPFPKSSEDAEADVVTM